MVVWEEEVDHATVGAHVSSWKRSSRRVHHRIRGETFERVTTLVGRSVHVGNRAVGSVVPGIWTKCWVHVLQLVIGTRGVLGRWGISHHRYVPPWIRSFKHISHNHISPWVPSALSGVHQLPRVHQLLWEARRWRLVCRGWSSCGQCSLFSCGRRSCSRCSWVSPSSSFQCRWYWLFPGPWHPWHSKLASSSAL